MQDFKNLRIIDTHFHIWERDNFSLDWIKGTAFDRDFTLQDYLDLYEGLNLVGAISIEVDSNNTAQEFDYIQNLVYQKTKILGFCVNPNVSDLLLSHCVSSGLSQKDLFSAYKLCGVRQVLHTKNAPKIDSKEIFMLLDNLCKYYPHLSFEACILDCDLLKLLELAKAFPTLTIVLNHFGNPKNLNIKQYAKDLARLGLCKNVYCKLSPSDNFMPLSESNATFYYNLFISVLNSFDSKKLLFGSNYPVSLITPKQWVQLVYENLKHLDSVTIANIFENNAYTCYNITPPIQRFGQIIGIKKEKIQDYIALHNNTWKGVLQTLKKANIYNYSIYHYKDVLFAYFEYRGNDFARDMAQIAQDPITQEWWKHTDICQIPMPEARHGQMWLDMQEVFHLD